MSVGAQGAIRLARQNSGGTATTAPQSFHSIPFISESIVLGVPEVISDTIRNRYEEGPSVQGYFVAGGDVTFRILPDNLGAFLYSALGTCSSTLVGSVTTHVFCPVQTQFSDDLAQVPWTMEKFTGNSDGESHFFHDGQCSRLMLEIAPGQYLRGGATFMFRTHSLQAQSSGSYPGGLELTWNQVSLSIAGTGNTLWENMTLSIDNALQYVPALDQQKVFRRILRTGYRTFRLTGTADFPNNNEMDKFIAGSEQAIDMTVTGVTLTGSQTETVRFQMPNFRYGTYPVAITGPGRITVGFTGRAVFNQGSGYALMATLVNTRSKY